MITIILNVDPYEICQTFFQLNEYSIGLNPLSKYIHITPALKMPLARAIKTTVIHEVNPKFHRLSYILSSATRKLYLVPILSEMDFQIK